MAISTMPPFPIFFDAEGDPLEDGQIFIGVAGLDPEANPIPTYWDELLTQAAPQPIRTSGGYMVNIGTPAVVYVDAIDYSMTVRDRNGVFIFNSPNVLARFGGVEITGTVITSDDVSFIAAGTGAIVRTATSKLREWVSVLDFGAIGDGVVDDASAFILALASADAVYVPPPPVAYRIGQTIFVPPNKTLFGTNRNECILRKSFNGPFVNLGTSAEISNLFLDGEGTTFTGNAVEVTGSSNSQKVTNCRIEDVRGYCLYFELNAGGFGTYQNLILNRNLTFTASIPDPGQPAIKIQSGAPSSINGRYRHFSSVEATSSTRIEIGDTKFSRFSDSTFAGIEMGSVSTGNSFIGCRIEPIRVGEGTINVIGTNHTFIGLSGFPTSFSIVLGSGATGCLIEANNGSASFGGLSMPADSYVLSRDASYLPTFSSSSGVASIGSGDINGSFSIVGRRCFFRISCQFAGDTTYGTGALVFSLPHNIETDPNRIGGVFGSGALYDVPVLAPYNVGIEIGSSTGGSLFNVVLTRPSGAGYVTGSLPFAFANGDNIIIEGCFIIDTA